MFKLIVFVVFLSFTDCLNFCDDWIQFKDLKCFKVLEKKGTEEEAVGNCTQLDQSSTLITIHSKEEQEFLNNILIKFNNISLNSWIGIKYLDKTYKWMNDSPNNYTNWSEDAVKDGTDQCAQMSLVQSILGKWTDVSCKKISLIVCQKSQEISLTLLKNIIEKQQNQLDQYNKQITNLTQVIEKQLDQHNKQMTNLTQVIEKQETKTNSLIPIGFLYTQLPNTSAPNELWPQFKWQDVTRDYSGLFFRAEGGESLPFGQIQQQNQSFISQVFLQGYYYDSWSGKHGGGYVTPLNQTDKWIETNHDNLVLSIFDLRFWTTSAEVRPKNTAVKIFKRI